MKNAQNKTRFKLSTRILSLFLTLVLLFLFVPTVVYAEIIDAFDNNGSAPESTANGSASSDSGNESEPIYTYKGATYEETSLREESVKHFKLEDGSYVAAQYGMPVHYANESGKWQDIDNSLSEASGVYANSTARIKFAKKINGSAVLFTLKDGNTKLEMSLIGANKGVVPTVINGEDAEAETELQKLMSLEKLSSTIIYPEILDGIDVEYIAHSLNVKENIIVKERKDSYSYSFELKLNGLTATLAENGDIEIYDKKSGDITYVIPAPVVYDANGKYAPKSASSFSLSENGNGKYILTVSASSDWINADERAFPITIDPTIAKKYYGPYPGYSISSMTPADLGAEGEYLCVTENEVSGEKTISTIHFSAPFDFFIDYISRMEVYLYCTSGSGYVGSFEPNGMWWPDEVSWNDLEEMGDAYSSVAMDHHYVTAGSYYAFDVMDIAFNCARQDKPTSFAVLAPMTSDTLVEFNNMTASYPSAPYMLTEYCNMTGIEAYWPTSSHSVGNAGVGTVNIANGNLTFEIPLLSSTDSLMPIDVSAIYNLNRGVESAGYMPQGFRLNIAETIKKKTYVNKIGESVTYYVHTDSDGTEHAYNRGWYLDEQDNERPSNDTFWDEDGLQRSLKLNDYTDPTTSITITDDSKIKMHFFAFDSANWYLAEIEDQSGNKIVINYDITAKRPTSIALQPVGLSPINMVNFHYNSYGKLYIIDNGAANDAIIFDLSYDGMSSNYSDGNQFLRKVTRYSGSDTFDYENWKNVAESENLSEVTEVYSCSYTYNQFEYLEEVVDNTSNYKIRYTHSYSYTFTYAYLYMIEEYSGDTLGTTACYAFDYYYNGRITYEILTGRDEVDDNSVYYYMDSYGRVVSIYDITTASSINYEYENSYKLKNNVKLEYVTPALPQNHIVNAHVSLNNGTSFPYWSLQNAEFYAEHYEEHLHIAMQPTGDSHYTKAKMSQEVKLKNGTYTFSFDYVGDNIKNLETLLQIQVYDDQSETFKELIGTDADNPSGRYSITFDVNKSTGSTSFCISIESEYIGQTANIDGDNDGLLDSNIRIRNISLSEGAASVYTNIVNNGTFDDEICSTYNDEENNTVYGTLGATEFWKAYSKALNDGEAPIEQDVSINTISYKKTNNSLKLIGDLEKVVYAKQNVYTANRWQLDEFDALQNKSKYNNHLNFYVGCEINSLGAVANEDAKLGIYVEISYYQGNDESVKRGVFVDAKEAGSWLVQELLDTKCPDDEKEIGKYYGCIQAIDIFLVGYKQPNGSKMYFDNVAFVFVDDAPRAENTYKSAGLLSKRLISYDVAEYYYYTDRNLTKIANDQGVLSKLNYDAKDRLISVENYSFSYPNADESEKTKWQGESSGIVITPEQMTVYTYDAYGLVTVERSFPFELDSSGTAKQIYNELEHKVFREFETTPDSRIFGALLAEGSGYEMAVYGPVQNPLELGDCENAIRYFYEYPDGRLSAEVSINGNWGMEYCYNNIGELISVFPAVYEIGVSGEGYEKESNENYALYHYNEAGRLSRISSNKVQYDFYYGDFGNVTEVGIDYDTVVSYDYYENNGNIKKISYANGSVVNYVYNNLDLLSEIWYTEIDEENGTPAYTYEYDKLGRLFRVKDYTLNSAVPAITEYQYDNMGNISSIVKYTNERDSYGVDIPRYSSYTYYGYDENSRLNGYSNKIVYESSSTSNLHTLTSGRYTYDNFGYLQSYIISSADTAQSSSQRYKVEYSYDEFNRLISRTADNTYDELSNYFHNFAISESFGYNNTNVSLYNITIVDSVENTNNISYSYEYDADGNITKVVYANSSNPKSYEYRYYYDNIGQLIRVDDTENSRTIIYTYDYAGNITKKERYDLTAEGEAPTNNPVVYEYTYGNNNWEDQLTSYNGYAITYDEIGNPLTYYNGASFEWQDRELVGYQMGNSTYSYTYDTNGMRTSKTEHRNNGNHIVTNYVYNGTLLVSEETNGNITVYVYDPSGSPVGFQYHKSSYAAGVWDSYYYVKNIQGDIVEIYNDNGIRVAIYSYDEYGKPTARHLGSNYDITSINHLMYRGYYYDFKMHSNSSGFQDGLGLYYLGSRYYDANIGRFISPDDISYLGANGDLNAYNLYAYCSNNPAMQRQMNNFNTAFNSSNNATKSINESNGVFANPWSFSAGLLTDTKYDMPSWLSVSALYAKGTLGWGYSVGDGYSLVSLSAGILDATFHTPKWFDSLPNNHIANPNIYLGVGTWNAYTSIGAGFSGSLEIVSCTIGIRFGDAVNIDVKGYVGAGFAFDLTNGFKFGGGVPFGYEISFNIDWYKLFN